MPSEQFQTLAQILKSRPRLADFGNADQRALFEEITSQFPVADGTPGEPVRTTDTRAEWIVAPGTRDGG